MKLCIYALLSLAVAVNLYGQDSGSNSLFGDDESSRRLTTVRDSVYLDTLFEYIERSADMVLHVANNGNDPNDYTKFFFGTNVNYTDVGQHYDYPTPRTDDGTITQVMLLGYRAEIFINEQVGADDNRVFSIYNADELGFPTGEQPLASFPWTVGIEGRQLIMLDNPVEITSETGFFISWQTYNGDQTEDDILVFRNSYCVVPNGPNDGRGERRFKVKLISDGTWQAILDLASFADCDAYVFPILQITEDVQDFPNSVGEDIPSITDTRIYPNPSSDRIEVRAQNPLGQNVVVSLVDMTGKTVLHMDAGQSAQINAALDVRNIAQGMYRVIVQNAQTSVSQNVVVNR